MQWTCIQAATPRSHFGDIAPRRGVRRKVTLAATAVCSFKTSVLNALVEMSRLSYVCYFIPVQQEGGVIGGIILLMTATGVIRA